MKVLVCVKQVPRVDRVRFLPGINRIEREGVESGINPLDEAALGHALRLKQRYGAEVIVSTMGPPSARTVLEEALDAGADRAVHLMDPRFAGADTLATARALARLVTSEQPDLVLLGRGTVDGGTAQVAPQLAELSGLAQLTHAERIEVDGRRLTAVRGTEAGEERWTVELPAVVSLEDGPAPVPRPSRAAGVAGAVTEVNADDLGGDSAGYGIRGSATYVQKVIDQPSNRRRETIRDETDLVRRIDTLARAAREPGPSAGPRSPGGSGGQLWVVAQPHGDGLHPVTAEGIASAARVAARLDASTTAVLLCDDPGRLPDRLAEAGADRVLVIRHAALRRYAPRGHSAALAAAVAARAPIAVIGPWTVWGRDYLPRVAARLGLGMTGDVTGLEVDPHPGDESTLDLVWLKPAWAGTALARVVARTVPSLGTLRPGAVPALAARPGRTVDVETVPAEIDAPPVEQRVEHRVEPDGHSMRPTALGADVLLLLGAKADAETVNAATELAAVRDWAIGGTPGTVVAGRLPTSCEVSLRRYPLSPRVVIGLGLAGTGDLDPVRGAATIVTVDGDPAAAVHDHADLAGILSVPELLAAFAGRPIAARDAP